MRITLSVVIFWALVAGFAYPLKRSATTDLQVLAFANVLEQLESAFYTQALERFNASSFEMAGFASSQIPIQQIETIASDENIHATALESAIRKLGNQAISNCTFNFPSALTNVDAMIATARVVENVGVGAYLGALTSLVDPELVATASSILTVEARHQTILNLLSNTTSIPQPFDVPLTPEDVLAIAGGFISGCKLGFSANPPLIVTNNGTLQAGVKLDFAFPARNRTVSENQLSCQIITGGSNGSSYQPLDSCMVPANVTGPMYVFITHDQAQMAIEQSSNVIEAKNSGLVAGPALLFVNEPDLIGRLVRPGLDATSPATRSINKVPMSTSPLVASITTETTTAISVPALTSAVPTAPIPSPGAFTTTISPAQASALLSSLMG